MTVRPRKIEIINREISWIAFNDRVLQEASDPKVPIIERLRFLGIFSNNQDEFFKVRVATLRRMVNLGLDAEDYLEMDPKECLEEIQERVLKLQVKFEKIYRGIIKELEEENIHIVDERQLTPSQGEFVRTYFKEKVRSHIVPIMLSKKKNFPQLKDKSIYLAVKITLKGHEGRVRYSLIELPTNEVGRFLVLPEEYGKKFVMLIDDVVRYCLEDVYTIFEVETIEAHTIKLTRDAELDIEEDVSKSLLEKLQEGLENRKKGRFVRFVYDEEIPSDFLDYLIHVIGLKKAQSLIPGGRYHNFKDFIGFPTLGGKHYTYEKLPPLAAPEFKSARSLLNVIGKRDVLLTYPFQRFDYIIDLLREAAIDPHVRAIRMNVYRLAKNSKIVNALINAARNGKMVQVVLELQARFDEKNNLTWSEIFQDEGVKVTFGVPGLKVHAKLLSIERQEGDHIRYYSHIGTGNFHEGNAKIYTDHSLLTADKNIGVEVSRIFNFLEKNYEIPYCRHLMVSPFSNRSKFLALINHEIKNAKAGKPASIVLKLNNLVDREMIAKLYTASNAGVRIKAIVRGICSLVPGVKGISEHIEVISVVDRFLEHTRVAVFHHGGKPKYYISSADWMSRNLDRRVEVTTPIYDPEIQKTLSDLLEFYLQDNVKARIIDKNLYNLYVTNQKPKVQSQLACYHYFKARLEKP
ncbi:MAG TPA: polyphosphate kinase 1 [Luteibaculaceae bacterium]|nr:polyphosphate kinase 1 [Luteibaculaceae bacterium]